MSKDAVLVRAIIRLLDKYQYVASDTRDLT